MTVWGCGRVGLGGVCGVVVGTLRTGVSSWTGVCVGTLRSCGVVFRLSVGGWSRCCSGGACGYLVWDCRVSLLSCTSSEKRTCLGRVNCCVIVSSVSSCSAWAVCLALVSVSASSCSTATSLGGRVLTRLSLLGRRMALAMSLRAARIRSVGVASGMVRCLGSHVTVSQMRSDRVDVMYTR